MSTLKTTNLQHASAASPAIVLASDSTATLNGLAYPTSGSLSGRNRIINGGFDIWQRATSQSTTGYGSADRWNLAVSGTCTFSQETSVVPSGAQYALKWTTGAASSYGQARQYIEQLNIIPLRGQTLTASAYVRSGGGFTGNIIFEIGYSTSTDASSGSFTVISTTTSGTINSSSYTQIKTTFTVPSNAVGLYVGIVPDVVQGNGATVYQSLVQLEPGSVATPFERRSYGQELALCQRYFNRYNFQSAGWNTSATNSIGAFTFPVMRDTPNYSLVAASVAYGPGGQQSVSSLNGIGIDKSSMRSGFVIGGGLTINAGSVIFGTIDLEKEL